MKHWTLPCLQTRLINTGGHLVRPARGPASLFRLHRESSMKPGLIEVLMTSKMMIGILGWISGLRLAAGLPMAEKEKNGDELEASPT